MSLALIRSPSSLCPVPFSRIFSEVALRICVPVLIFTIHSSSLGYCKAVPTATVDPNLRDPRNQAPVDQVLS